MADDGGHASSDRIAGAGREARRKEHAARAFRDVDEDNDDCGAESGRAIHVCRPDVAAAHTAQVNAFHAIGDEVSERQRAEDQGQPHRPRPRDRLRIEQAAHEIEEIAAIDQQHREHGPRVYDDVEAVPGRFGVDAETFDSTFESFAVHTKLRRADDLIRRYRVQATPTVVVNGKYVTSGTLAGSYETWFEIINELTAAERAATAN